MEKFLKGRGDPKKMGILLKRDAISMGIFLAGLWKM